MKTKLKIFIFLFVSLLILPLNAKAITYNALNLKEALAEEEIEEAFTDYNETKDQITIYLFRGKGCGYCRAYLTFMNSITSEYGKYFKMVSYEVWNDEANSTLMNEVSNFLGQPASGVPYIIIGDKVFAGYTTDYDESIKTAIMDLYNTKKRKRYDVMKELKKSKNKISNNTLFAINLLFVVIATSITLYYVNTKVKELNTKIDNIIIKQNNKVNGTKQVKKQVKKEVKTKKE